MKHLAKLIRNWRWMERITAREAAEQIGLSPSTYSRLERGCPVDGGTLAIVLTWLLKPDTDAPKPSLDVDLGDSQVVEAPIRADI
jgi:DNA-binding XRE family transcriptional regulator